jgi:hypothetical protein
MALLASGTALVLSIGAACVAAHSWRQYRSSSAKRLLRQLTDLEDTVETLTHDVRNIRSRLNMRELRARRAEVPPETTAPTENGFDEEAAAAAKRAELNDAIARGAIKANPS